MTDSPRELPSDRVAFVQSPEGEALGIVRACPASITAVFGVEEPTRLWCGREEGHDGNHYFQIEWADA